MGQNLVKAAREFGAPLRFTRGVTLEPDTVSDFAAEHNIAIGTSFEDVLADRDTAAHRGLRRDLLGRERERDQADCVPRRQGVGGLDHPPDNHLGRNLDYFAKAALGQGAFPISPAAILQTAAALEAVFKSVDADGAWMAV